MTYIERFTNPSGDVFIKFPLISNLPNLRGWAATPRANELYARTGIGKPITIMRNILESRFLDLHPFDPNPIATTEDHKVYPWRYAIGRVVDVTNDSGKYKAASGEFPWFAIGKIQEPSIATEMLKPASKLIPPAFSPGIWHIEGPNHAVSKYEILHVAAVPEGAYGPRFVTIDKCKGDLNSCAPLLKAASYKEKNGCCPLEVLSSLFLKSASADNIMSLNPGTTTNTPGPTYGTSEIRSPDGNNTLASQTAQQPIINKKPTIKIRLRGQSTEPNGENNNGNGDENGKGDGEIRGDNYPNQEDSNENRADYDALFKRSSYYKELQDLKSKYKTQAEQWAYKEKRNEIEKIIPKRLFTDQKGRFRQKDWENEVERAIKENVPLTFLQEYYSTKEQLMEVPEIQLKRASAPPSSSVVGSIPNLQGASASASSIENAENQIKSEKLLKLFTGDI